MEKVLVEVAKKNKTFIIYRDPTEASKMMQVGLYPTKLMNIKTKSGLEAAQGFLTLDPQDGKLGLRLLSLDNHDEVAKQQLQNMMEKHRADNEALVKQWGYSAVALTREFNGKKWIAVSQIDPYGKKILGPQWKEKNTVFEGYQPVQIITRNHIPMTADTDLFIIGNPEKELYQHSFSKKKGNMTEFESKVIDAINRALTRHLVVGNPFKKAKLIQHGTEVRYAGTEPDDLVAIGIKKMEGTQNPEYQKHVFPFAREPNNVEKIMSDLAKFLVDQKTLNHGSTYLPIPESLQNPQIQSFYCRLTHQYLQAMEEYLDVSNVSLPPHSPAGLLPQISSQRTWWPAQAWGEVQQGSHDACSNQPVIASDFVRRFLSPSGSRSSHQLHVPVQNNPEEGLEHCHELSRSSSSPHHRCESQDPNPWLPIFNPSP